MNTRRDPRLAAVLSLCWPGLGQLYNGRPGKAALLLAVAPGLAAVLSVLALSAPARGSHVLGAGAVMLAVQAGSIVDAVRDARRLGDAPRSWLSRWWAVAGVYTVATVLMTTWSAMAVTSAIQAFKMPTAGMEPTLLVGDHVVANMTAYGLRLRFPDRPLSGPRTPRRGDLIVFLYPEDRSYFFAKRVIGLPGETIEIRERQVLVDGKPLDEPYAHFLRRELREGIDDWGPETVPAAALFVLGDNRDNSKDSRYWGFLPVADVRGQLEVVYYSVERGGRIRWDRIGREVH